MQREKLPPEAEKLVMYIRSCVSETASLLTFTVRALDPLPGVRGALGIETEDGFHLTDPSLNCIANRSASCSTKPANQSCEFAP